MTRAAFIDFQGTLGGAGIDDITALDFFPFSITAIKTLNAQGILVIGITNQSHIAKGELTWDAYRAKLAALEEALRAQGAWFDAVYCCPHRRADGCACRKPLPGMVEEACARFSIDLPNSYIIGDMGESDMMLAKNVGARGILVLTGVGRGSLHEYRHTWQDVTPYAVADNVLAAAEIILRDCAQAAQRDGEERYAGRASGI